MKKSIKKACSVALLLTSTVALTGANALVVDNVTKNYNAQVYADQYTNSPYVTLNIPEHSDTVFLGETYNIPQPTLKDSAGKPIDADRIDIVVTDSVGRQVDFDGNSFVVNGIGEYTITYSVEYSETTYTTDITVTASVSENTVEVVSNTNRTLPGDVYLSYTGNIYIPTAEVVFADEDLAQEYTITTTVTSPSQERVSFDAETGLLDPEHQLEEGTYSVTYTARTTEGNIYLDSLTEEFTVLSDTAFESKYGDIDYTLSFDYSSTAPTTADIGDELVLPQATGRIGSQQTPVYYTIQAYVYIDGRTYEVTNQTISTNEDGEYVFTAQKKYTISGQEYTVTNGRYQFYYNVTDALGKRAERTGFTISGVKDTQRPTIIVTDPYSLDATENIEDKSYNLQNNFELGQNVILKAVYAEDLADDFSELKIERYIRKSDQSSKEEDIYNDSTRTEENVFTKDIVFNRTDNFAFDAETMIDAGDLTDGTYTAYYRVTDSAGNTETINYTFVVDKNFSFAENDIKTSIEFQDTFPVSINRGDRVIFTQPLASNDNDDRLETRVYYKFDNAQGSGWEAWTLLEVDEDGNYVIPTDVEGAKSLTIRAMAISDAPKTKLETNVDETADISNYLDENGDSIGFKYGFDEVRVTIRDNQDSEAPQVVTVGDWEGPYTQNSDITIPTLTVKDDLIDYVDIDLKITHTTKVDDKTVTQDFYAENAVLMTTKDLGDPTRGQLTFSGATFYANLAGTYNIVYEITDAANNKICVYQSIEVTENDVQTQPHFGNLPESLNGGTLEFGETLTLPIPELPVGDYGYNVNYRGPVGSQVNKETFTAKREGTYTIVYTLFHNDNPEKILDTKEFVLEVSDSQGPNVRVEWDLEPSYAVRTSVMIPVFTASDASGINLADSTIVISSNSFRRTIYGDDIATEFENGEEGRLYVPLNYNEVYTVTYTVYDNSTARNSTVVTRTIRVGDLVEPTIILPDNYVSTTVKLDTTLRFDTKGISVTDTNGEGQSVTIDSSKVVITIEGPNGDLENVHVDDDGEVINDGIFEFDIDTAGEYTVTISVEDEAGNEGTIKRTFTVNDSTVTPLSDNEIITIVLICVAVLVLAGAVVYAIISSKNTKAYKQ